MKLVRHICQIVARQQTFMSSSLLKVRPLVQPNFVRFKYFQNSGVKGFKGRQIKNEEPEDNEEEIDETSTDSDLFEHSDYDYIANSTMNTTKNILNIQNVVVLQPYVKWGPKKSATKPELALQEAEALVRSIPTWTVEHSMKVPMESLDKQTLFGSGKIEELKKLIHDIRRNEKRLEPKNQLFATLDVTAHTGYLPSHLKVIYMDTVGFMSEIPTGLIECFVATLEDAMLADVIIHVHDVSHENYVEQRKHVEQTLQSLLENSKNDERERLFNNIINVGNKCDLIKPDDVGQWTSVENLHLISSKTLIGINDLMEEVEEQILVATNRKKITIRIPMGREESVWLYKNSAVTEVVGDPKNEQKCLMTVIISEAKLQQFRHIFVGK